MTSRGKRKKAAGMSFMLHRKDRLGPVPLAHQAVALLRPSRCMDACRAIAQLMNVDRRVM